jgi:DNA/RNA endonuclease YhcR with UshA esterase domain
MNRLLKAAGRSRGIAASACALSLLLAAGCDTPSVPEGTPGTVEVRAFIDQDGSGSYTPGTDTPVAGLSVSLVGAGGSAQGTATTGSDGTASFPGVLPGGYSVEYSGSLPEGAVLASGTRPSVSVPAQGGTVQARFRFVSTPGNIQGMIYRDADGSGDFDPEADEPGEGFLVELFQGEDVAGEAVGQVTTGADGSYAFDFLRPGAWTLRVNAPAPLELVGDPTRTVTVTPGGTATADFLFEGDLLVTVAQARELDSGAPVLIEGTVAAPQNTWNPREVMVQDATGGILVFVAAGQSPALQLGDRVRVSGTIGFFSGDVQITNNPVVEFLGVGAPPAPRTVTGAELLAGTFNGQLARLDAFRADSINVQNFDNHDVFGTTVDGSQVVVRVDSRAGIASADWTMGLTYSVTGSLRFLSGQPRIFPRSRADFFDVDGPLTLAQIRRLPLQSEVTARGVVLVDQGVFRNDNTYIQEGDAGILVFAIQPGTGLVAGDTVVVEGSLGAFQQELQITRASPERPTVTVVGSGPPPEAVEVTGAQVANLSREGTLGLVPRVTVTSIAVFANSQNINVTADDGATFVIRIDNTNNTGISPDTWEEGASYRVRGILTSFQGNAQLKLRSPADVEEID